ncbi:hydantoinase B/oxoprolinase family protein [Siccirubricoccus sp. KC 17139]|uniref:Hydantoinase B/oxoprolinase family protein n=1 Tax=Siccirubricoccus soli TaxID=2899147 RepID=A0ABT1D4L4_9PROT|nr:hydantoinase B/oxoprolinase family protein [Siccirubricoccus soli]MCO6416567.1 hydantoinase B/oxoprolinase family protein [Siccirubricoccus soli]MCP2682702.1 hydantoinase B/oxoprolinase family protein [Siccirubricoccus soli]
MTHLRQTATDPILLAIVQKQLDHVSRQMGWVMTRTARSPIFSQSHDFSCFVGSRHGDVIAQADGIPIHTGGGGFAIRAVLRDFAGRIGEGDVFLLSDPYAAGGNHLPDWTIIRPVHVCGNLLAFACNRAHQSDIGGGAAGTYNAAATEIFHEGIRLPVLKLVEGGVVRDDLWRLLLLNTRCPDLMEGDLAAMLGSTRIGAERLAELLEKLAGDAATVLDAVLSHADRSMRSAVASLPDGEWEGQDGSDTDCFEEREVPVVVRMTKRGDTLRFDFTGSSPQIRGFKNSSLANTHSAVYMALSSFFDPAIPRNEGTYRCVEIVAPEGTVVNALPPAPMTMNTVYPAADIVHACWKTLAQAAPAQACAGWGKTGYGLSSGRDRRGRVFVMYHWGASPGAGAVEGRDGFGCMGQFTTLGGLSLPNVETSEAQFPVRILKQEFRTDAAGPGEYRGGPGVHYEAEILVPTEHSIRGEGTGRPSGFGVNGGGFGAVGSFETSEDGGHTWRRLPRYGVEQARPMRVRILSAGGGGWGDPARRSRDAVQRDIDDGIISPGYAQKTY